MHYELHYWPGIPGRGEFVRLALEEAGADYMDIAAEGGSERMQAILADESQDTPPFAPPFLKIGSQIIAQTANILFYLGGHHDLAPQDEAGRLWVHQLQLTLADWVVEAHDAHHPLGPSLYYEDQKPEATRRSSAFRSARLPKFLGYFERILARNGAQGSLAGHGFSYVDLSLFQVIEGLRYAFPRAMARLEPSYPGVAALTDRVKKRPHIAAYLASTRRLPFNENGIFRHYPELDDT